MAHSDIPVGGAAEAEPGFDFDGWNYRVVRFGRGTEREWFVVRECYYNSAGKIIAYIGDDAAPGGVTTEELRGDLDLIAQAFTRPIIDAEDLPVEINARGPFPDSTTGENT